MTDRPSVEVITTDNQTALEELVWAVEASAGQFSLILARCNYRQLRSQLLDLLPAVCTVPIRTITIPDSSKTLYSRIREELEPEPPHALMIVGLEAIADLDEMLPVVNMVREEFRKTFQFPIVLWVTRDVHNKLVRLAPDFESWATTTDFDLSTDVLLQNLEREANDFFATVLAPSDQSFRKLTMAAIAPTTLRPPELEAALYDLHQQGVTLSPDLQASLELVRGLHADDQPIALTHFQNSLAYWQSQPDESGLIRTGLLLNLIGRFQYWAIDREKYRNPDWEPARKNLVASLEAFEQANRLDLAAKVTTILQRCLLRIRAWDDLETVTLKALQLHQAQGSSKRLAQDYSFLAEVALHREQWLEAKRLTQQALDTLATNPQPGTWEEPLYRLSLAQAERQLGNPDRAIDQLNQARSRGDFGHPIIYSQILAELQQLESERQHYLAAFQLKQERYAIEQQYGIRAFIGAGRLQPKRIAGKTPSPEDIAPEIAAAGRQQDLDRLLERIGRNDYKIIVLHGNSGVGKSSLINAGLVPTLARKPIGIKNNVAIVLRTYTNWETDLQSQLALCHPTLSPAPPSPLTRLQQLDSLSLRPVLIFDQFEEFFFVYPQPEDRRPFFQFLAESLQILAVKVILSLREDYLHYLLECNRLSEMQSMGIDILSQNVRYGLGNFSPTDAKAIIASLSDRSRFYLEPALVEQLVADLARDMGEVRPIELQVVGAQLQEDKITRLEDYRALGENPKQELVKRYLEAVIADCGPENRALAEWLLYLLTDEKGTRPLKTRSELEKELQDLATKLDDNPASLDLVLQIIVDSGLAVLLPEVPEDRYQLVHDYLAAFIRQQQEPRLNQLMAELKQEREHRQRSDAKLNRFLKRALISSIIAGLGLAALTGVALWTANQANQEKRRAEVNELETLIKSAEVLSVSGRGLDALIASLRVVQKQRSLGLTGTDLFIRTAALLQQTLYWINEQNSLDQHTAPLQAVSFSPDGKTIATASDDNTVKLWNREGKELKTLKGHTSAVNSVSFSPDGKTIVTASDDNTVKLWSREGRELQTLRGHNDWVNSVSFSPDGKTIATASDDKTMKLWNREGKALKTLKGHTRAVKSVSFSPDGKTIATASDDNTVKLWNREGRVLQTLKGHTSAVSSVSFSPDSKTIATASADNTVKLWNREGKALQTLKGHTSWVNSVSFSPDSKTIATASADNTVKLWNPEGKELQTLIGHTSAVSSVSFSPDGKTIATASDDKTMKLWNRKGQELQTLKGHTSAVYSVSFSPDGQTIATASGDNTAKLWNREGQELKTLKGHTSAVYSVSFSPDGQTIATASGDNTAKLWNREGQELKPLKRHADSVLSVSFSPDSKTIATASGDSTVKLWNREGKELQTLKGHTSWVHSVSFSPDGQTIATASGDNTVKLWNREGKELQTLKGHTSWVHSVSFSPDGQTIATASRDSTVKLWNREGRELQPLKRHTDSVYSVSFSPDSKTIATASRDSTVKLWNHEGKELQPLKGHTGSVSSVSFSPDGKTIATASYDKTVKLWNLGLDELVKESCQWSRNYLATHISSLEELQVCQDQSLLTIAAATLVLDAEQLARQGDINSAVAKFDQAKTWNHTITFNSQTKAKQLANQGHAEQLIDDISSQAKQGEIKAALASLSAAQKLDPQVKIPIHTWDYLCWYGSLHGSPDRILFACEKAVALAPKESLGYYRDSRGIARAMMGDAKGALSDFEAFIQQSQDKDDTARRQRWIESLRRAPDRNPFTPEDMNQLRD